MLYQKHRSALLKGSDRVKLINQILMGQVADGGCELNIYELKKAGVILDFFPLHDEVELRQLESKWFVFWQMPKETPITLVRDYFGEKIALFFGCVLYWIHLLLLFLSFFS